MWSTKNSYVREKLNVEHVIDAVIKTVSLIGSRVFNVLFQETDVQHGHLVFYSELRWHSHGAMPQIFLNLLKEINCCMKSRNKFVSELVYSEWIKMWDFFVNINTHLNILNLQLQYLVQWFTMKLWLWKTQHISNNFLYFPTLKQVSTDNNDEE